MSTASTTIQRREAGTRGQERTYTPRADLYTGPEALLLQVDLPGVSVEGLSIEVHAGQLELVGRRSDTLVYRRVLRLPEGIDSEAIRAKLDNGVLSLTLPKAPSHVPRKIAVETSGQ